MLSEAMLEGKALKVISEDSFMRVVCLDDLSGVICELEAGGWVLMVVD